MPLPTILIKKDREEVARTGAELFVEIARRSIHDRGRFSIALSGGSTPAALYRIVASDEFRGSADWNKVYFFFGDERNVALDSSESNYRMAKEALLDSLPVSPDNVRPWRTSAGDPVKIADHYESELKTFFDGYPVFDLMLLGLGADGHTASLFPGTAALRDRERIAVANWVPKLDQHRLTLTFPVINGALNVVFVVTGDEKAGTVRDVIEGKSGPHELPAQMVQPKSGNLIWLLDVAAASRLRQSR